MHGNYCYCQQLYKFKQLSGLTKYSQVTFRKFGIITSLPGNPQGFGNLEGLNDLKVLCHPHQNFATANYPGETSMCLATKGDVNTLAGTISTI